MRSYWFNPAYWATRHYVKQYVELIEANPRMMDDPKVRANLARMVSDAQDLGWLD